MRAVEPMEIGLVFWAEQDAGTTLEQLRTLEIRCGQLGVPPQLDCNVAVKEWADTLNESDVSVTSAVCAYAGEDYSSLETVHETVGFTTQRFRAERIARTNQVSNFAAALGLPALSCHIGFIPNDQKELLHKDLCELTRSLCDSCGSHGQTFVLETGQESAEVLLSFIHAVDRPNLKVNFDPANMIMYGSGDPVAALKLLSEHVLSVHCKDAHSPLPGSGTLGSECVLGDGEVDFPAFLQQLKEMRYQGPLSIEREEPKPETRLADILTGVSRLREWKSRLGL